MKIVKREVIWNILLTCQFWNLKFIGTRECIVVDKGKVYYGKGANSYFLFLQDEIGEYKGLVGVYLHKYQDAKVGNLFGQWGIILNKKHANYVLFTKHTEPGKALKNSSILAITQIAALFIGTGLTLAGVVMIILAVFF